MLPILPALALGVEQPPKLIYPTRPHIIRPTEQERAAFDPALGMLPIGPLKMRNPGAAGPTDPNFSSVKLLIGADTAVTDESSVGRTITAVGNAARTTSVSKFGAGSLVFDGTGDSFNCADSADWDVGGNPFTVELWARFLVKQTNQALIGQWDSSGQNAWFFYLSGSTLRFRMSANGGSLFDCDVAGFVPTLAQWYKLAWDRDTSKARIYIDGTMSGSSTNQRAGNATVDNRTYQLNIGLLNTFPAFDFQGNMDEIRYTKGVARYASDGGYTVPTAAFPRS